MRRCSSPPRRTTATGPATDTTPQSAPLRSPETNRPIQSHQPGKDLGSPWLSAGRCTPLYGDTSLTPQKVPPPPRKALTVRIRPRGAVPRKE